MKTTPYTDLHIKLGAKMAEFAGYNMPIQYTGLVEEHNNVRNNVGVFDVSHMGEFRAKGPIAKHFMQYVTTNNVEDLFDGKVQYTCLPNGQGGVVDDMLVYRVHDDEYFMVPNAANIDKDWAWMSQIADKMGMELGKDFVNESEQWAQLAVQGPNALKAMRSTTPSRFSPSQVSPTSSSPPPATPAQADAKSTYPKRKPSRCGTPSSRLVRNTASCPQALAAATPSVWRKASPSTATRWTTPSAPSRPLWHSSSS